MSVGANCILFLFDMLRCFCEIIKEPYSNRFLVEAALDNSIWFLSTAEKCAEKEKKHQTEMKWSVKRHTQKKNTRQTYTNWYFSWIWEHFVILLVVIANIAIELDLWFFILFLLRCFFLFNLFCLLFDLIVCFCCCCCRVFTVLS